MFTLKDHREFQSILADVHANTVVVSEMCDLEYYTPADGVLDTISAKECVTSLCKRPKSTASAYGMDSTLAGGWKARWRLYCHTPEGKQRQSWTQAKQLPYGMVLQRQHNPCALRGARVWFGRGIR